MIVLHICNYGYFSQVLRLKTFCFVEFWAHAGFDTIKALLTYLFCANAKIYKCLVLKTKLPEKLVVQSSIICNNIRLKRYKNGVINYYFELDLKIKNQPKSERY